MYGWMHRHDDKQVYGGINECVYGCIKIIYECMYECKDVLIHRSIDVWMNELYGCKNVWLHRCKKLQM